MSHRVISTLTFVLVWVALSSCSGSDNPEGGLDSDGTSESESTTGEPVDLAPEEAAIQAFDDVLTAIAEAGSIPDSQHPAIAESAEGEALESITALIQGLSDAGTKLKGEVTLHDVEIEEATPESDPVEILIRGCMDTSTQLVVDIDTEQPVEDEEYGRRLTYALVEQLDSGWIVTDLESRSIGTC